VAAPFVNPCYSSDGAISTAIIHGRPEEVNVAGFTFTTTLAARTCSESKTVLMGLKVMIAYSLWVNEVARAAAVRYVPHSHKEEHYFYLGLVFRTYSRLLIDSFTD